ncbi:hypothetical protein FGO68_gene16046 [Halteria grandinella]|uniref:Uncharacterized protein n=1 Tax=Halteria grandinella TaxID=5974 RepID=A0A8J8NUB0_HALGN|nr:hypothetical protein FGO68_gene16046 [Halteria grandinella]
MCMSLRLEYKQQLLTMDELLLGLNSTLQIKLSYLSWSEISFIFPLQEGTETDADLRTKIFLGTNAACFLIYTLLTGLMLKKVRGVPLELRSKRIISVFVFSFFFKSITWLYNYLAQSTSIAVMGTLQMIDNTIQCGILITFFVFIFEMKQTKALCQSQSSTEYKKSIMHIKKQKRIFIGLYTLVFLVCLITFFEGYIRGKKEPSFYSPRIVILWTFLMIRFILDVSACIMFLQQFFFFLKIKVEKLYENDRDLTGFHKFVILYIVFALTLEFLSSILRSFFGPLILVGTDYSFPIAKFADKYRLLLYSISDFFVGLALLYLFYTQGMLAKFREEKNKRAVISFDKYKDLDATNGNRSTEDQTLQSGSLEVKETSGAISASKRSDWESKLLTVRQSDDDVDDEESEGRFESQSVQGFNFASHISAINETSEEDDSLNSRQQNIKQHNKSLYTKNAAYVRLDTEDSDSFDEGIVDELKNNQFHGFLLEQLSVQRSESQSVVNRYLTEVRKKSQMQQVEKELM